MTDREEQLLREWHPAWFADSGRPIDQLSLAIFRSAQKNFAAEIRAWSKAFLDFHPVDEQRTPEAVQAWSNQIQVEECYHPEMVAEACRLAVTIQAEDDRKQGMIDATRQRMEERLKALAIYDGDVEKARQFYHVGEGWWPILDEVVRAYGQIEGVGFLRAGTKWASLRVEAIVPEEARKAVKAINQEADDRARHTCEICGKPGELRTRGWHKILCPEHAAENASTMNRGHLQSRWPDWIDDRTKIEARQPWMKFIWQFCEQIEQLDFDHRLLRLHHVYEQSGQIMIDYDSGSLSPATIPPRIKLKIKHIAEEIALESKLESKG